VRKSGDDLRITAQFIDAKRDVHLWADTYRGNVKDVFEIQDKVSGKIVEALRMRLTKHEKTSMKKQACRNDPRPIQKRTSYTCRAGISGLKGMKSD